jgi:hypothetical protein
VGSARRARSQSPLRGSQASARLLRQGHCNGARLGRNHPPMLDLAEDPAPRTSSPSHLCAIRTPSPAAELPLLCLREPPRERESRSVAAVRLEREAPCRANLHRWAQSIGSVGFGNARENGRSGDRSKWRFHAGVGAPPRIPLRPAGRLLRSCRW